MERISYIDMTVKHSTKIGDENSPISFKVGTKKVADGLNLGVNGMEVGGQRRLYVPSELNPQTASGLFPANANLIFEVELLEVK